MPYARVSRPVPPGFISDMAEYNTLYCLLSVAANTTVHPLHMTGLFKEYDVLLAAIPEKVRVPVHVFAHATAPIFGYRYDHLTMLMDPST